MITSIINSRGNAVPNQFVIAKKDRLTFQSYKSIIAHKMNDGRVVLDSYYWDYSVTTLKHLKTFLDTTDSKKDILAKIESGEYKTRNLN